MQLRSEWPVMLQTSLWMWSIQIHHIIVCLHMCECSFFYNFGYTFVIHLLFRCFTIHSCLFCVSGTWSGGPKRRKWPPTKLKSSTTVVRVCDYREDVWCQNVGLYIDQTYRVCVKGQYCKLTCSRSLHPNLYSFSIPWNDPTSTHSVSIFCVTTAAYNFHSHPLSQ